MKKKLWQKEKEIIEAVKNNKEVVVRSCNASGKTFTSARIVHWWLWTRYPSIVLTTAPTWRQVKEILWREIHTAGKEFYPSDRFLETKINLDSNWFALGLSTDRVDQFQGFHSENLLVIVDEASGVNEEIYQAIDGLKPNKLLLIGNPLRNTGRFAESFKNRLSYKIHISAFDTPNLVASGYDSFEKFREDYQKGIDFSQKNRIVINGLITLEDVVLFAKRYGIDSDVFRVRVLGEFPKRETESWISLEEIEGAMNREVIVENWEEKVMGVDTARFGNDRTVLQVRHGKKFTKKIVLRNKDAEEIVGQIINLAKEEKIRVENIKVDIIGVNGLAVVKLLKQQGFLVTEVNFAEKASDSRFANLRAECFFKLKEDLKTGQLPKDEDYWELANIKYKYNIRGQIQIESKEEMKMRGLESPDVADACALTYAPVKKFSSIPTQSGGIDVFYNQF